MANFHLRDKSLSLKAVGLLSKMLSFNDGWKFSTKGLSAICKEGPDAILSALRELEKHGYLVRHRQRDGKGRMSSTIFEIYEEPQESTPEREIPHTENPCVEKPDVDNPRGDKSAQINTDQVITQERNNLSKNYQSINLDGMDRMDERSEYEEIIKENLDYDILCQDPKFDKDRFREIMDIMLDAVCSTAPTIRINGEDMPQQVVKSRFLKLNSSHIEYVLEAMSKNPSDIRKTVIQNGWKAIEELFKSSLKTKEKDDPMKSLPEVHEGDVLDGVSASVTEHFTTPPKPYTEDTLLSAMETAGNDQFDDDTEKKGLGTPATRAGIIEKLVKSGFAERKGKSLIPTKDGCNLVCVLPEQITSPTMTAEWENTLMEIERGNADADTFLSGIVRMTGDLVKAYPFLSDAEAQRFGTGKEEIGKCPRCGSPVYVGKGNFYCSNKACSFCLWEDNKFFSSKKKKLTKKIAKELLDKGWCRVTGLYTPKKPQLYDAVIRLDDSGGKYVSFKMEFDR